MISFWPAEGNSTDVVGPNSGTQIGGVTFTTGRVGQAFLFDGMTGMIAAPTTGMPTGASDRSIEMWVRIDAVSYDQAFFGGYGTFGQNDSTYHVGALRFGGRTYFSQWGMSMLGPAIPLGTWTHVAATTSGGSTRLYVAGSLAGLGSYTLTTPAGTMFNMGRIAGSVGNTERMVGALDEIAVYDRELSASEVAALANSPLGKCR